jgi:hypothetical protein
MTNLLNTRLYVGDINDLSTVNNTNWAIVHATQTIHYQYFGWNRTSNKPDRNHPNYIVYEQDNHLSLNWVDGPANLYSWSGIETFNQTLDFIDKWISCRNVLVHCDQGHSRSPSLCMLFLAKRANLISNVSYECAKNDFIKIYANFSPGGIGDFINANWTKIE